MKVIVILTALSMSSAMAQFAWDEEPLADPVQAAVDRIDDAVRTPVDDPVTVIFQPFVSPVLDADPRVEDCDLEPRRRLPRTTGTARNSSDA